MLFRPPLLLLLLEPFLLPALPGGMLLADEDDEDEFPLPSPPAAPAPPVPPFPPPPFPVLFLPPPTPELPQLLPHLLFFTGSLLARFSTTPREGPFVKGANG